MKKIYLSFADIDLGYLQQNGQNCEFVAYEQNILNLENENPMVMQFFKLNKTGSKQYLSIPEPFSRFLISNSRKDLFEKADIKEEDGQFEKLYKLAGLNMMDINFKIHQ